jgi:hypothetical protein
LTPLGGGEPVPVSGLVDSGADKTVLPIDYAELLGYSDDELERVEVGQVEGSVSAWDSKRPCRASVAGLSSVEFEMQPIFVATLDALWGRADLMGTFVVSIAEREKELMLHLPEA